MNFKPEAALPESIRVTPQARSENSRELFAHGRSIKEKATTAPSSATSRGYNVVSYSEIGCWVISGICAFIFTIVILTPILVPLLSFGSIFSEGWGEWSQFTKTAVKMSITPALIGAGAAALAMGLRKGKDALRLRLEADSEKGVELRRFDGLIKPSL